MKSAPYKIISGQKWTEYDWNETMKYAPDYSAILDEELPQTEKECREDRKDLINSALPIEVKVEWNARYDAQIALIRENEERRHAQEDKSEYETVQKCSTQVELLLDAVQHRKFGATLKELVADARKIWPSTPRTIVQSVCRLLHDHCSDCRGFKGKRDLFAFQTVGKRKIWFAR